MTEKADVEQKQWEKKPQAREKLKAATIIAIVILMKQIRASVVDEHGNQLYPYEWNNKFAEIPVIRKKDIKRPAITSEIMNGLATLEDAFYAVLFCLLGATGARIGEMLAIEIDKHISSNFRTITISQQVYRGVLEERLKTDAAEREIDLHPAISEMLKWFVGNRTAGFLFPGSRGARMPVSYCTVMKYLNRALENLGYENDYDHSHRAGTHIFRRYRITYLRNHVPCPEGLRKFWLGHECDEEGDGNDPMGDKYDKIAIDKPFRLRKAEEFGYGFTLPLDVTTAPKIWRGNMLINSNASPSESIN